MLLICVLKKVSIYIFPPTIHEKVSFHSLGNLSLISPLIFASQKGGHILLLYLLVFTRLLIRLKKKYIYIVHWPFIFLLWWRACIYIFFSLSFFSGIIYSLFSFKSASWGVGVAQSDKRLTRVRPRPWSHSHGIVPCIGALSLSLFLKKKEKKMLCILQILLFSATIIAGILFSIFSCLVYAVFWNVKIFYFLYSDLKSSVIYISGFYFRLRKCLPFKIIKVSLYIFFWFFNNFNI